MSALSDIVLYLHFPIRLHGVLLISAQPYVDLANCRHISPFIVEQSCFTCGRSQIHGSGCQSPAFQRGGRGSIPGQSLWDS